MIRHTHPIEIPIGIEPLRTGLGKLSEKFCLISAVQNIVADVFRLLHIQHNQIFIGKGTCGDRFLMVVFPMNDRGVITFFVFFNAVPHLRHPRTSGVYDDATAIVQQLHFLHTGPKRRQNHHVSSFHHREVFLAMVHFNEQHAHLSQMVIHRWIVDDFIGDPNALRGELFAGFIGHGHRPFHPPTKPECLGQANGHIAPGQHVAIGPQFLN